MEYKDYYKIMGVDRKATQDEITVSSHANIIPMSARKQMLN